MADEIENARPKGLLIPFDKLKLLDILDDVAFRQVFRAMAAYVKPEQKRMAWSLSNKLPLNP